MSLKDRISSLRHSFIEKLPDYLTKIETECETLGTAPQGKEEVLQALFLQLHSIKGGASTFGLTHLFETSKIIEQKVVTLIDISKKDPESIDYSEAQASLRQQISDLARVIRQTRSEDSYIENKLTVREEAQNPDTEIKEEKLIYICDDAPGAIEHLRIQLKYLGYTVIPFTDTHHLYQAVIDKLPAAIVMDIMFPAGLLSGPEVISKLRDKLGHQPPVIFISGRNDYASRYAAIKAGGSAYYVKPLKIFDLVHTLDELTNTRKSAPNKILVVDDDLEVAKFHCAILNDADMTTKELYNPEDILDTLVSFKPDLVLMDMHMPRYSGIDIAKIIRQIPDYISLPIIYLSSETDVTKQAHALRVGAEGFLTKPVHPLTLINEVNVRVQRMRELSSLMVRDSLTGLYNHTFMQQFLEKSLASSQRTLQSFCTVMIDIDHFKRVNDCYGHQVGDEVLITISRLLKLNIRESDAVGRYGGEEFMMVLNQVTEQEAIKLVDEIRTDFSKLKFEYGDTEFQCTFSAGISSSIDHQNATQLLESADKALYESKHTGRNRVTPTPEGQTK